MNVALFEERLGTESLQVGMRRTGNNDVLSLWGRGDVRAHDERVHLAANVLAAHAHGRLVAWQYADGDSVERHRMNGSFVIAEIHAAATRAPRHAGRVQRRMPRLHSATGADADGVHSTVIGQHKHEVLVSRAKGSACEQFGCLDLARKLQACVGLAVPHNGGAVTAQRQQHVCARAPAQPAHAAHVFNVQPTQNRTRGGGIKQADRAAASANGKQAGVEGVEGKARDCVALEVPEHVVHTAELLRMAHAAANGKI